MKAFILAAALLPCALFAETSVPARPAQEPPLVSAGTPQDPVRGENYLMTFFGSDMHGDLPEVSVVIALSNSSSGQFSVLMGGPGGKIDGLLRIGPEGLLTLDYMLVWETQTPKVNTSQTSKILDSSIRSSVCLNPNEEVQILRVGTRSTRVSIRKLEAVKSR